MGLFRNESFTSHAGVPLSFKIECDALTDEDIATIALRYAASHAFSRVVPIPRGGLRFAMALEKFLTPTGGTVIVDDVFTSGMSMDQVRAQPGNEDARGVVIFARSLREPPPWIEVFLQLSKWAGP